MSQYLVNNSFSTRGATMIELMAMIAIIGLGVGGMFNVVASGVFFAKDTEDTIKAINLARDGIEGVTTLRNTNWLRFSSDRTNCWKVHDYRSVCIGDTTGVLASPIYSGSSILYTNNGLWYLSGITVSQAIPTAGSWQTYYDTYKAIQDTDGFFNQTGSTALPTCDITIQQDCQSIFTREIVVIPISPDALRVKSIVRWNTKRLQSVELETILTNWKSKF